MLWQKCGEHLRFVEAGEEKIDFTCLLACFFLLFSWYYFALF